MDGLGMYKLEAFMGSFSNLKGMFCLVLTSFRPDESQMPLQGSAILSSKNDCFYISVHANIVQF